MLFKKNLEECPLTDFRLPFILRTFSMPNKHAAIKDLRKNERRAARNARMKTHLKALDRHFQGLLKEGKAKEAKQLAEKLQQALSKAAKNAVIHKNKAARRLSATHQALKKLA